MMNPEERNVMTIVTLARIVESTLWYCLPPRNTAGFPKEERDNRYKALKALTGEGSPFYVNCERNGDTGKELYEEMNYFIDDVYGNPGRIVTEDLEGRIHVESSLVLELFSQICKIRAFLEAFIQSAMKFLKESNKLSPDFEELVNTDIKYYHCFAGKISCMMIADKFLELNKSAKSYTESYSKQHNGINPTQDPEFNVRNDPAFRMAENEFHELNQDMITVLNSYGENDADFRYLRDQIYSDCDLFTGKKSTTDIDAYFRVFTSYFDKTLAATQGKLNVLFARMSNQMSESLQADEKKEDKPEEATAEERKEEAKPEEGEAK